jgi:hypothetical protein
MRLRQTAASLLSIAALAVPVAVSAQTGPAWVATHLSSDVLTLACAPALAYEMPAVPLRITGGQSTEFRVTSSPGDLITINAGTANGIQVGQEFFARRVQKERDQRVSKATPGTVRTAGWIRVYAVDEHMSLATIVFACDALDVGDYLEPFTLPTAVPTGETVGKPERDNYGRVVAGNDRRTVFTQGDLVVIDRGRDHGIVLGSQFVVYHDKHETGNFLVKVGEAVAVEVRETSATLNVTSSREPVAVNDYVAMRK